MILTAGLSPAWQQILVFDRLSLGAVNRASDARWCASGKVLNAGIAAHCFGVPTMTLTTVGGAPAMMIEEEFAALGVPRRWVKVAAPTRVCTTIIDRGGGAVTELVENSRALAGPELKAFTAALAQEAAAAEVVVLTGSLPDGTHATYYRELLEQVRCPAVLDFRGPGLMHALPLRPLIVKPNRLELQYTIGRNLATETDVLAAMRELNRAGAVWVMVSDGPRAIWLTSSDEAYRFEPLRLTNTVNPTGSGDAMAAGLAWSIRQNLGMVTAVCVAIAAAAGNAEELLPCRIDAAAVAQRAPEVKWVEVPA